jgi:hypothetical protein
MCNFLLPSTAIQDEFVMNLHITNSGVPHTCWEFRPRVRFPCEPMCGIWEIVMMTQYSTVSVGPHVLARLRHGLLFAVLTC